MFTQAGFNPRRRFICYAFITRGTGWIRAARLVRFSSGEYAWDGGAGRISWPEQLVGIFKGICTFRGLDVATGDRPSCPISDRPPSVEQEGPRAVFARPFSSPPRRQGRAVSARRCAPQARGVDGEGNERCQ